MVIDNLHIVGIPLAPDKADDRRSDAILSRLALEKLGLYRLRKQ